MNLLISIFLIGFSLTIFAQEEKTCETPGALNDLEAITGKKCLSSEIHSADLKDLTEMYDTDLKTFCQNCKSEFRNKANVGTDGINEKESLYGKAILDEFQKDLTLLSLDLMKIRSSFKLDFDPKKAIKSCSFQNLKKPSCLTPEQSVLFDKQIKSIQNAMANELANILSSNPEKENGLLDRVEDKNTCSFSDHDVLFAQARYHETLITPEIISDLKKFNIPRGKSLFAFLKENKLDQKWEKKLADLKQHPIFQVLLKDTTKLNDFISGIKPEDTNQSIVEKLYASKHAKNFGDSIQERCEKSFTKTSEFLKSNFCEKSPGFIADNLKSMEAIVGKKFENLQDKEAEPHLQVLCSHLNTSNDKSKSFSEIRSAINSENQQSLVDYPLTNFKSEAYNTTVNKFKRSMCEAKGGTPSCEKNIENPACQMLNFLELSKTSKGYQEMANASGDNINLILRSLVGEGRPEKAEHVVLLQNEGILPGGDASTRPQQQDAGTFFKTVNSGSNGTNANPIPQTKTTQNSTTQFKPTTGTNAAVDESSDEDPTSTSKSTTSNNLEDIKKTDKKFSALSDEEQQNILNRMKPKRKAGKYDAKGFSPDAQKDSEPFFANSAEETSTGSFNNRGPASTSTNTAIVPTAQNTSGSKSGNYAKIDPTVVRKDGSYNKALEQAKNNDPSALGNPIEESKLATTKNESGLKEIEIKVADETILKLKAPEMEQELELKMKIQEFLKESKQSLLGTKKFVLKLGKYKIHIEINNGVYIAKPDAGGSIHPEYYAFLSRYFTEIGGIKERVSSRQHMEKIINEESVKRN